MRNATLNKTILLAMCLYVTAAFIMFCARPAPTEDSCTSPTLAVVATPSFIEDLTGLGVVCVFEGVHG